MTTVALLSVSHLVDPCPIPLMTACLGQHAIFEALFAIFTMQTAFKRAQLALFA